MRPAQCGIFAILLLVTVNDIVLAWQFEFALLCVLLCHFHYGMIAMILAFYEYKAGFVMNCLYNFLLLWQSYVSCFT